MKAAGFSLVYFIAIVAAVSMTRYEGGVAYVWLGTALLTARLVTQRREAWPLTVLCCTIANVVATALFGLGPKCAVPIALTNSVEAVTGAFVLYRLVGRQAALDSHRWLASFVFATGMLAPAVGAVAGGITTWLILGQSFERNAAHWYAGHALGTLAFMPIATMVMRGDVARLIRTMPRAQRIEHLILILLVATTSIITFAQTGLPLLFLPMLPIVLATFRGGALSTAASIVIVSVVGAVFTIHGHGPIALMDSALGDRMQFLQFYVAATMLTVLPATAELERRAELFRQLRDSEARYRMLTDHSSDIVLNVDLMGRVVFASPSIRQIGGYAPETLIGRSIADILHPEDRAQLVGNIAATLANAQGVSVNEYRALNVAGDVRWMEARSRPVLDDDGIPTGLVSVIRDVTDRRAAEQTLALAALTDPLTGLANRRAFEQALETAPAGCVALFDLDHFKRVNDRHGHAAGDEVLRRFAAVALASLRDRDLVARIGGEEFAVLLPGASPEQARLVSDRLRAAIAQASTIVGGETIRVTVSGGVAPIAPDRAATMLAADAALYRAKAAGRDRLAMAA